MSDSPFASPCGRGHCGAAGEGGERSELPLISNVKGIRYAHPLSPTLSRVREREQN